MCMEFVFNVSKRCLEGVLKMKVLGRCLKGVWMVFGMCLKNYWKVSNRLEVVLKMSRRCLKSLEGV